MNTYHSTYRNCNTRTQTRPFLPPLQAWRSRVRVEHLAQGHYRDHCRRWDSNLRPFAVCALADCAIYICHSLIDPSQFLDVYLINFRTLWSPRNHGPIVLCNIYSQILCHIYKFNHSSVFHRYYFSLFSWLKNVPRKIEPPKIANLLFYTSKTARCSLGNLCSSINILVYWLWYRI